MGARRMKGLVGIVLMGYAVLGMAAPGGTAYCGGFGPEWYRRVIRVFAGRPVLVRTLAARTSGPGDGWRSVADSRSTRGINGDAWEA